MVGSATATHMWLEEQVLRELQEADTDIVVCRLADEDALHRRQTGGPPPPGWVSISRGRQWTATEMHRILEEKVVLPTRAYCSPAGRDSRRLQS
jgi:hypothetical protein